MNNKDYALRYAKIGWHVVPTWPIRNNECTCDNVGCTGGKHPIGHLCPNGLKNATVDIDQINQWWNAYPDANISIATGEVSGFDVVDVDNIESMENLNLYTTTLRASSGSGVGMHLFYAHQDGQGCSTGSLPEGVDVRGTGGLITVEPSNHASGLTYQFQNIDRSEHSDAFCSKEWIKRTIKPWPKGILDLINTKKFNQFQNISTASTNYQSDSEAYSEEKVSELLSYIHPSCGYDDWWKIGAALYKWSELLGSIDIGYRYFDDWSKGAENYDANQCQYKYYKGCNTANNITQGTLYIRAKEKGWNPPSLKRSKNTVTNRIRSHEFDPDIEIEVSTEGEIYESESFTEDDQKQTAEKKEKVIHDFTDWGNAKRLIDAYGTDIKYCPELSKRLDDGWYLWDNNRWVLDRSKAIWNYAKATIVKIKTEESGQIFKDEKDLALQHYVKSQSQSSLSNMLSLAQSEQGVPVLTEQLDANPYLLGVKNGVINLRNGKLIKPKRELMITQSTSVAYDENAKCPQWENFLLDVFEKNENLCEYLQRLVGYLLTGDQSEQKCFFFWGEGANGKSTLIETLQTLLGDYAATSPATTFMDSKFESVSNDLAMLRGARMVAAAESGEGKSLDETLIKSITGGDAITARFLFREFFTYRPQFKVILATNHMPRIEGNDHGIWRRINLVPFGVKFGEKGFPPQRQKTVLKSELESEISGVLNWAIEGCLNWQKFGLSSPSEVKHATDDYRDSQDALAPFFEECCDLEDGLDARTGAVEQATLYRAYQAYETDYSTQLSSRKFSSKLRASSFEIEKTNGKKYWKGIALNSYGNDLNFNKRFNV